MSEDLYRGGVNCCFRHVVHRLMSRIRAFGQSELFEDYLRRDKRECETLGVMQHQEDAGSYLMRLLEKERWAKRIWNKECGIRFVEWKKPINDKWTFKRGMEREPMMFIYPSLDQPLSASLKSSLRVETPELTIVKRIQHPPPRYLVLNMVGKVETNAPIDHFRSISFGSLVRYEMYGMVLHLGPPDGMGGHYIYLSSEGYIYNDMDPEVKRLDSIDKLQFTPMVSPTLILYRRTSRRKNPRVVNVTASKRSRREKEDEETPDH
jgi:hypothetical protein